MPKAEGVILPGETQRGWGVLEGGIAGEKFKWCVSFLEKRGKELYGEKFKILEQDHEIIFKLIVYFLADKYHAASLGIDLQKGMNPISTKTLKLLPITTAWPFSLPVPINQKTRHW